MKKPYMLLEIIGDGPDLRGYDSWLCPYSDWAAVLGETFDSMDDPAQIVNVRFTFFEFSDAELADYCEENGIEWE